MSTENAQRLNDNHSTGSAKLPVICRCDSCGKSGDEQAIVEHGEENWCLDCMRLAGHCITCNADIRLLVDDYFTYDDDQCPQCVSNGI